MFTAAPANQGAVAVPTTVPRTHDSGADPDPSRAPVLRMGFASGPPISPQRPQMNATRTPRELIVPATHRGLRYKDGALTDVLAAGRYKLPRSLPFRRGPVV